MRTCVFNMIYSKIESTVLGLYIEMPVRCTICHMDHKSNNKKFHPIQSNKGTGAGGSLTTYNGIKFENITDNLQYIQNKYDVIYLDKTCKIAEYTVGENKIIYMKQHSFKKYVKKIYDVICYRNPDEAYVIELQDSKKIILIVEKKNQNGDGSVDIKLWAAPALKLEYEMCFGPEFEIQYCLCVSDYFKKKLINKKGSYKFLVDILAKYNIDILFGNDTTYFEILNSWIEKYIINSS